MVRRWMCGVVVVAVVFGSPGWSAPVMAKQPLDFFGEELVVAELGAMLGGSAAQSVCWKFLQVGCPNLGWLIGWGTVMSDDLPGIWVWGMGRAFGAGVGATLDGGNNGVQGNVIMAFVLPGGLLSITSIIIWSLRPDCSFCEDVSAVFQFPYLAFVPATLAVIGFNIGAKMKDTGQPASLPWTLDLPVLSLEFWVERGTKLTWQVHFSCSKNATGEAIWMLSYCFSTSRSWSPVTR